jgi:hypothetical protein
MVTGSKGLVHLTNETWWEWSEIAGSLDLGMLIFTAAYFFNVSRLLLMAISFLKWSNEMWTRAIFFFRSSSQFRNLKEALPHHNSATFKEMLLCNCSSALTFFLWFTTRKSANFRVTLPKFVTYFSKFLAEIVTPLKVLQCKYVVDLSYVRYGKSVFRYDNCC